jgi:hypothetical protein
MKTIVYYVSDYGFGHATRSIAMIRRILSKYPSLRIFVKSDGPYDLLVRSFIGSRVSVIRCRNDIAVPLLLPDTDAVDKDRTRDLLLRWMGSWESYIAIETRFCSDHAVDMIISDIAPQPFIAAAECSIPSIAVSNFSWDSIYQHLFPDLPEVIEKIRTAYGSATLACQLPFFVPMDAFRTLIPVSLLARDVTVTREKMRKRLGIPNDETVVFFNPRCPPDQIYPALVELSEHEHVMVILPSGYPTPHAGIIPIAPDETESQNWIGMCDLVVTRCGYSTVSEAVQARVPLIVWERLGFIEDWSIASTIEHLGIGSSMDYRQVRALSWMDDLPDLPSYKQHYERIDHYYCNNRSQDILDHLKEYLA